MTRYIASSRWRATAVPKVQPSFRAAPQIHMLVVPSTVSHTSSGSFRVLTRGERRAVSRPSV